MLKIYLARHGEDMDNVAGILNGRRDQPLSERGVKQAQEAAERIKNLGVKFEKIYSSPLKRAFCTAEIIAKGLGMEKPEVLEDLIERNFGEMSGVHRDKIMDMCAPDILQAEHGINYMLKPKGGETFPETLERAGQVIGFIKKKHPEGSVLLVSHMDIGKMIYASYYNLDWQEVLKKFHFGNSELILMAPDSSPDQVKVFEIKQYSL